MKSSILKETQDGFQIKIQKISELTDDELSKLGEFQWELIMRLSVQDGMENTFNAFDFKDLLIPEDEECDKILSGMDSI